MSVKITVFIGQLNNTGTNGYALVTLWDGTVGSGTQIGLMAHGGNSGGDVAPGTLVALVTPAAGSKTYNVGLDNGGGGGTAQATAGATSPMLLMVESVVV